MLPAATVGPVPGRALGCSLLGNQGHCRAALSPCNAAASPREWGIPAKLQGVASWQMGWGSLCPERGWADKRRSRSWQGYRGSSEQADVPLAGTLLSSPSSPMKHMSVVGKVAKTSDFSEKKQLLPAQVQMLTGVLYRPEPLAVPVGEANTRAGVHAAFPSPSAVGCRNQRVWEGGNTKGLWFPGAQQQKNPLLFSLTVWWKK